jgi:hypothetical protein
MPATLKTRKRTRHAVTLGVRLLDMQLKQAQMNIAVAAVFKQKKRRVDGRDVPGLIQTTTTAIVMSTGRKPRAKRKRGPNPVEKPLGRRTVEWRVPGSPKNELMRAAVWTFRFVPRMRSRDVQLLFGVPVKSLMRYVYDSCKPEFAAYNLFFGEAGHGDAGNRDRAIPRDKGRTHANDAYAPNVDSPDVPRLTRFVFVQSRRFISVLLGEAKRDAAVNAQIEALFQHLCTKVLEQAQRKTAGDDPPPTRFVSESPTTVIARPVAPNAAIARAPRQSTTFTTLMRNAWDGVFGGGGSASCDTASDVFLDM